jgi:hypothetical protein
MGCAVSTCQEAEGGGRGYSQGLNTDVQRTLRHSPSHSNTPLAADQPLDSGSQVSGAVHGLALRQKSDDSEVRWVKSLTPENYTATASLVNVRGQCLNASLVVAPRREQSLAPSTAFNHSGGGASWGLGAVSVLAHMPAGLSCSL